MGQQESVVTQVTFDFDKIGPAYGDADMGEVEPSLHHVGHGDDDAEGEQQGKGKGESNTPASLPYVNIAEPYEHVPQLLWPADVRKVMTSLQSILGDVDVGSLPENKVVLFISLVSKLGKQLVDSSLLYEARSVLQPVVGHHESLREKLLASRGSILKEAAFQTAQHLLLSTLVLSARLYFVLARSYDEYATAETLLCTVTELADAAVVHQVGDGDETAQTRLLVLGGCARLWLVLVLVYLHGERRAAEEIGRMDTWVQQLPDQDAPYTRFFGHAVAFRTAHFRFLLELADPSTALEDMHALCAMLGNLEEWEPVPAAVVACQATTAADFLYTVLLQALDDHYVAYAASLHEANALDAATVKFSSRLAGTNAQQKHFSMMWAGIFAKRGMWGPWFGSYLEVVTLKSWGAKRKMGAVDQLFEEMQRVGFDLFHWKHELDMQLVHICFECSDNERAVDVLLKDEAELEERGLVSRGFTNKLNRALCAHFLSHKEEKTALSHELLEVVDQMPTGMCLNTLRVLSDLRLSVDVQQQLFEKALPLLDDVDASQMTASLLAANYVTFLKAQDRVDEAMDFGEAYLTRYVDMDNKNRQFVLMSLHYAIYDRDRGYGMDLRKEAMRLMLVNEEWQSFANNLVNVSYHMADGGKAQEALDWVAEHVDAVCSTENEAIKCELCRAVFSVASAQSDQALMRKSALVWWNLLTSVDATVSEDLMTAVSMFAYDVGSNVDFFPTLDDSVRAGLSSLMDVVQIKSERPFTLFSVKVAQLAMASLEANGGEAARPERVALAEETVKLLESQVEAVNGEAMMRCGSCAFNAGCWDQAVRIFLLGATEMRRRASDEGWATFMIKAAQSRYAYGMNPKGASESIEELLEVEKWLGEASELREDRSKLQMLKTVYKILEAGYESREDQAKANEFASKVTVVEELLLEEASAGSNTQAQDQDLMNAMMASLNSNENTVSDTVEVDVSSAEGLMAATDEQLTAHVSKLTQQDFDDSEVTSMASELLLGLFNSGSATTEMIVAMHEQQQQGAGPNMEELTSVMGTTPEELMEMITQRLREQKLEELKMMRDALRMSVE